MTVTMVEIDRLAKRYDGHLAVADVSLTIEKGEFIALMGPSGCGKTTTLRMIAGLDTPSEGEIRIWGRRINDDPPWARDTPLVWQNYALFPFLSVRQNVEFGLKQRGMPGPERAKKAGEWMERMGIAALGDRSPAQLSGGQRQRVALARALATEPEMLLLDEPLSALDPHLKVKMQAELVRLHRELGITFVCVTHSHSEAFAMADRVVIMNEGRVEQIGTPREIHRAAASRFVAEFIGGSNLLTGPIAPADAGQVAIDTGLGRVVVAKDPAATEMPLGTAATLVVAADRIGVSRDRRGLANEVAAQVTTMEFVGSTVTVFLEAPGSTELSAQISSRDLDTMPLAAGDPVFAAWPADAGYFLQA
ncbi:spermidine/putrescine import ATP-binding protein PotA [Aureimonas sp. SA4125]|uniref:ABC transporter ATP-binding protein n=1 Tax=Aureimonas sp. SA4125 TaxID=2826993 RepID=UPI001CC7E243|nr:ABC transporter ATP-binding protein [Aureimonas sp. SA4125]BDA84890.1 spermidine/putrescine import ATP-binding protein PotA [Aureimonas sp. SA4125]